MKRTVSLLIAAVMLLVSLPAGASRAGVFEAVWHGAYPALDGPVDGLEAEKRIGADEKEYDGYIDSGASIVLMDADTGAVLFEQTPNKKAYPASTTKVLSTLLAIESGLLDEYYTVGSEVVLSGDWSTMTPALSVGETISLRDMVYGAMLPSGCEASAAIGVALSGSTGEFAAWMNRRARALGMNGTHFVNANGISNNDHYTTAMDMARLCRAAINNAEFCEAAATYQYITSPTNMCGARTLTNTNRLITPGHQYYYQYAIGIKTGTTSAARYCLTALAEKEGRRLLLVILRAPSDSARYGYARQLFEWGFEQGSTAAADGFFEQCERVNARYTARGSVRYYYSPCADGEYYLGTAASGTELLIKYSAQNETGETWFFTEDGHFIPAAALDAAERETLWGFCEDGVHPLPAGEYNYGARIVLRGTAYADGYIEGVHAELVNAAGETVKSIDMETYSTYFDLVGLEEELFSQPVEAGEYTLELTFFSGSESYMITAGFTVGAPIPGDLDGDGLLTFTDVSMLSLYLTGESGLAEALKVCADYNGDGEATYADITDLCIALMG